jgi:hypothetical protein
MTDGFKQGNGFIDPDWQQVSRQISDDPAALPDHAPALVRHSRA